MKPVIRPMVQGDIPGALAVASSGWGKYHAQAGQPYFNEMFTPAAWRPFFYVATYPPSAVSPQIVGTAGYGVSWLNYGIYNLFWVGVLEKHRYKGIGHALVSRCLTDLAHVADQVILATDSPEFYLKNWDFTILCPLPTTQGPDDVLMMKDMRAELGARAISLRRIADAMNPGDAAPESE